MKRLAAVFIAFSIMFIIVSPADTEVESRQSDAAIGETAYPIAAGIWYPQHGPIPDKPMRYYRVRCWPGCHSGSALGKYPEKSLMDKPIYPTSTVNAHAAGKSMNTK